MSTPEEEEALRAATLKNGDIGDWFYTPSWKYSVAPEPKLLSDALCWVVFEDVLGLGAEVIGRLEKQGQDVVSVSAGTEFRRVGDRVYEIDPRERGHYTEAPQGRAGGAVRARIGYRPLLDDLRTPPGALDEESVAHLRTADSTASLAIAQAADCAERDDASPDRRRVRQDAHGDRRGVAQRGRVDGAGRVPVGAAGIRQHPLPQHRRGPACGGGGAFGRSRGAARRRARRPTASIRRSRTAGGQRWMQVFEHERFEEPPLQASLLRDDGVYLLTGGLGHIPIVLAKELADSVQARLAFVGRSKFPAARRVEALSRHAPRRRRDLPDESAS